MNETERESIPTFIMIEKIAERLARSSGQTIASIASMVLDEQVDYLGNELFRIH
jgi:hypothetical protein